MKNIWGAKVIIRDGENEYSTDIFIEADTEKEATKKIDNYVAVFTGSKILPQDPDTKWREFSDDNRLIRWARLMRVYNFEEAIKFVGVI
jgi:hypothetical protein